MPKTPLTIEGHKPTIYGELSWSYFGKLVKKYGHYEACLIAYRVMKRGIVKGTIKYINYGLPSKKNPNNNYMLKKTYDEEYRKEHVQAWIDENILKVAPDKKRIKQKDGEMKNGKMVYKDIDSIGDIMKGIL